MAAPPVDVLEPQVQSQGWVRAVGATAGLRQGLGHGSSLSVAVTSLSLFISLNKVMDTDCCELTLTLPFTTFSQGKLEKANG